MATDGVGPVADSVFTLNDIEADTDYVLCAVAYDVAGSYGNVASLPFRTQQLFPAYDEEYEAMLGEWTVDYTDFGSGERITGGLNVSIGRDVDGKTFRISGLAPDSRNNYGVNDTVIAKFVNGQICFVASTPVADAGVLSERYDVILCLADSQGLYTGGIFFGVRTGDTISRSPRTLTELKDTLSMR
ncbi:hypothetical protein [Alistipes putredinis]|uniref:hypothetical protein n=1 Tax=Alistipes putredinis TaxID=28117 RepID=UPI003FD8FA11